MHINSVWEAYHYLLENIIMCIQSTGPHSAVGNVSACRYMSDCRSRACEFDPACSHTFVKIEHEIISTAILPLPLIQEGLLSITSESMCTKYCLTA